MPYAPGKNPLRPDEATRQAMAESRIRNANASPQSVGHALSQGVRTIPGGIARLPLLPAYLAGDVPPEADQRLIGGVVDRAMGVDPNYQPKADFEKIAYYGGQFADVAIPGTVIPKVYRGLKTASEVPFDVTRRQAGGLRDVADAFKKGYQEDVAKGPILAQKEDFPEAVQAGAPMTRRKFNTLAAGTAAAAAIPATAYQVTKALDAPVAEAAAKSSAHVAPKAAASVTRLVTPEGTALLSKMDSRLLNHQAMNAARLRHSAEFSALQKQIDVVPTKAYRSDKLPGEYGKVFDEYDNALAKDFLDAPRRYDINEAALNAERQSAVPLETEYRHTGKIKDYLGRKQLQADKFGDRFPSLKRVNQLKKENLTDRGFKGQLSGNEAAFSNMQQAKRMHMDVGYRINVSHDIKRAMNAERKGIKQDVSIYGDDFKWAEHAAIKDLVKLQREYDNAVKFGQTDRAKSLYDDVQTVRAELSFYDKGRKYVTGDIGIPNVNEARAFNSEPQWVRDRIDYSPYEGSFRVVDDQTGEAFIFGSSQPSEAVDFVKNPDKWVRLDNGHYGRAKDYPWMRKE